MKRIQLRSIVVFVAFTVLALTAACIHKSQGKVTPKERAAVYNTSFAQINNTIEQGAEAAANSGVITAGQAAPIIAFTGRVAELHKQITLILGQATTTQANIDSIATLLDQIKAAGDQAIASGALGIKNPRSQQKFTDDLNALYSAADAILAALKQSKGGV